MILQNMCIYFHLDIGYCIFADSSADCLAPVPDGQCSMADLKPKGPPASAGPLLGGRAASLTHLSLMYSTGLAIRFKL